MTDPDQCIICLEPLPFPSLPPAVGDAGPAEAPEATTPTAIATESTSIDPSSKIASLSGCGHVLHDSCIRLWAQKTNTCPICRTPFQEVRVLDGVDGTELSRYKVEDKKQVAEFDLRDWLEQNPEEEVADDDVETAPCPICNSNDHEEVLLLCDSCDAGYHTYCVGLDDVPEGHWYCMECAELFAQPTSTLSPAPDEESDVEVVPARPLRLPRRAGPQSIFPRTRQRVRRARRQARSLAWEGAWGQFAGRVYDALGVDLDNNEDDDALEDFRRSQRQRDREHQLYRQRWQQRLNIASRLGAREVFADSIPRAIGEQLRVPPTEEIRPTRQSRDERLAWGALDRIREAEQHSQPNGSSSRKRKTRSVTASPVEPAAQEPERKLKRPRTRRLLVHGESSTTASSAQPGRPEPNGGSSARSPPPPQEQPSFLSSLLREVEMSTPSDDENVRNFLSHRNAADAPSPVASPSPSSHNSPRALSITPPPMPSGRSSPLSLSSYIEPRYPKANYSPNRASPDHSDSEKRTKSNGMSTPEIRQPRPQRPVIRQPTALVRSPESSPTRPALSLETKQSISSIVRGALKPHWRANQLTSEQYENINRDVSRKLYEEMRDPSALDDEAKRSWEAIATREVTRAVQELKA